MKKKSILIVCISALMALAMFVGCDNAPVVPSWPNGGTLVQKVDLIEGQIIPTDAFDAVVTYTDGTKKTFANVAVTGTSGVAQNGETVSVEVGYDYQGKTVKATGDVVAIPVDHIEVTLAEGAELVYKATDDNGKITYTAEPVSKRDVIVNAVTADGLSYKVSEADFTAPVLDSITSDDVDDEAETVTVTLTVTALGAAKNDFSDEIEVVAGIDRAPAKPFYTVSSSTSFAIAPFAYSEDEMPEITFEAAKVKGFYGDSTEGSPVAVTEDPGLEFSGLLDARTKLPIGTTDLTKVNAEDLTFAITYADNQPVYGKVEYIPVTVEVTYEGEGVYVGEALPAADQFKVLVSIGGVFEEITPVDECITYYVWDSEKSGYAEYTGKTLPEGGVAVLYTYKGVPSEELAFVADEDAPEIVITEVKLADGFDKVAKQFYTTDINETLTNAAIEEIKATKDGEPFTISPADVEVYYIDAEGNKINGKNLLSLESLSIAVQYGEGPSAVYGFVPVTLVDPVIEGIRLVPKYEYDQPMFGSDIVWTIWAYNKLGDIGTIQETDATVWINGETYSGIVLPKTVAVEAVEDINVVFNGMESNHESVPAGLGYITATGDWTAEIDASVYAPLIGDPVSNDPDMYKITNAYTTTEGAAPAKPYIEKIVLGTSGQKVQDTSTVTAIIKYVGEDGEEKEAKATVTLHGIHYTEGDSIKLVYTEEGFEEVAAGKLYYGVDYDASKFSFDAEALVSHVNDTVSYKGFVRGTYDPETSTPANTGIIDCDWADSATDTPITFVFGYTDDTGKAAVKTITLNFDYKPTEN